MSVEDNVRGLLADAERRAEPRDARAAWVRETAAAWRKAQRAMDEKLGEAVARLSEEEFDRLFDEEQAKVDLYRRPLMDAAERDLWPRELYFHGV